MWISSLAEDVGREILLLCCSLLRPGGAENFLSIGDSRSSRLQDEPLNKDLMLHRTGVEGNRRPSATLPSSNRSPWNRRSLLCHPEELTRRGESEEQ